MPPRSESVPGLKGTSSPSNKAHGGGEMTVALFAFTVLVVGLTLGRMLVQLGD